MFKHKFITGLVSIGVILFSAGLTYFALSAILLKQLPVNTILTPPSCEPGLVNGELVVTFTADIPEQMQDRIAMANKGMVKKRTYNNASKQYIDIIQVETGQEQVTGDTFRQTPGVTFVEQNKTACPAS